MLDEPNQSKSDSDSSGQPNLDRYARYSRQMLVEGIGLEGQRRLSDASVLLVGCGALGSVAADILVRAGVGHLRICDRDFIEVENLQRQVLYDESDIAADLPKAEAAARKLARANSQVRIEPVVADLTHLNISGLADRVQLILDGTDNFETRYLINDFSVSSGVPWVYGAVISTTGLCMAVLPEATGGREEQGSSIATLSHKPGDAGGQKPHESRFAGCLRCVFEEPPPPELSPSCDTAGVLASAAHIVAGYQTTEALKILTGNSEAVRRGLLQIDVWSGRTTTIKIDRAAEAEGCPCCKGRDFPFLDGRRAGRVVTLCGRNAVQIAPHRTDRTDLKVIADRLRPVALGIVRRNDFMVRAVVDGFELTCFADGRTIVKGTGDPDRARSIHARYIGT